MKKLTSMAMLFAMMLFVVGCGGAADTENGATAPAPEETPGYDDAMEDAAGDEATPAEETPADEAPAGDAAAPEAGAEAAPETAEQPAP